MRRSKRSPATAAPSPSTPAASGARHRAFGLRPWTWLLAAVLPGAAACTELPPAEVAPCPPAPTATSAPAPSVPAAEPSVAATAEPPAEPPAPPMTFADAVKDAATADPGEVSAALVPILPSTPGLVWSDKDKKKRVLMVTWTSFKGYDDQVGKSQSLGRETWVTPAPLVANFCKGKGADAAALTARLEQLLGLPANNGKDRFVELWTEPKDLFRPCPDPEITDRECGLDFPQPASMVTVSAAHVKWFEDLKSKSYGEGGYPWTRLGYTFDWAGPKVGLSEYVIKKGAEITVERVAGTADYCK